MAKQIDSSTAGLKFYYDEEIFNNAWKSQNDPVSTVLLESGAMVEDSEIARLIANGSNYFTMPFYNDIEGDEVNYDGKTNITTDTTDSGAFSGVVYGRAKGWSSISFVKDFTTADPMAHILARVQAWKAKKVQARLIGILDAVLGKTEMASHKSDITSSTATITDDNKIGLTTLRDLAVKANGDMADDYTLAIMHSQVANTLSQLQVINFYKFQKDGMSYDVRVGKSGNMTILVCDEVPHVTGSTSGVMEYTTYVLGRGVIGHANAPVAVPSEIDRDPATNGGIDKLYTRYRECIHPYGFSFEMTSLPISPTDAQLSDSDNWVVKYDVKNIYIASVKSNG